RGVERQREADRPTLPSGIAPRSRGRERPREPSPASAPDIDPGIRDSGNIGSGGGEGLSVPGLLWALHQRRFTGRLRLQHQRVEKQLWLRDGEATFARSNSTADRLVDGLLRRGMLTRPQYETARRLAAKEPRRAGQLLVEAGFLKPRELEVLLREHLARVIDACFVWTDGAWATEPGERSDEPIQLEMPLEALILDGARYRLDARELEARLVARAGRGALVPKLRLGGIHGDGDDGGRFDGDEGLDELAERFRLMPEEESWLRRFHEQGGRLGVAALLAEGADEQGLFALLYALDVAGLVELREEPELMPSGDREPMGIDSERILERLRVAREADYFELLGLGRDAARGEVRQAYDDLSKTFADEALESESRRRHARELRELRAALDEARDILADDAMRSAYLAHLVDDSQ
ncbi:MAG: DUF4388 domain-containing protein, partial [Myxococcales bacterium]|nr:DUF4388 domain-containing protein [Myxococcales bacterium]